jgi:hypothetical protein
VRGLRVVNCLPTRSSEVANAKPERVAEKGAQVTHAPLEKTARSGLSALAAPSYEVVGLFADCEAIEARPKLNH